MKIGKTRRNLASYKKANAVIDTVMVLVVLIAFTMVAMFGYKVYNLVDLDIQNDNTISNESKVASTEIESRFPNVFDSLFMLIFVGLWSMVIVASFNINTHPIFFIFSLILIVFVIIVSAYLGNFYEEIAADTDLGSIYTSFPMTHFVLSHLLPITIGIGMSILIVLFGKNRLANG